VIDLQLPDLVDYPIYGWEHGLWTSEDCGIAPSSTTSSSSSGANVAGEMLIGEDFDLASIPPIELGLSKIITGDHDHGSTGAAYEQQQQQHVLVDEPLSFHHDHTRHHPHHQHAHHAHQHESLEGLFGYEGLMAGY